MPRVYNCASPTEDYGLASHHLSNDLANIRSILATHDHPNNGICENELRRKQMELVGAFYLIIRRMELGSFWPIALELGAVLEMITDRDITDENVLQAISDRFGEITQP